MSNAARAPGSAPSTHRHPPGGARRLGRLRDVIVWVYANHPIDGDLRAASSRRLVLSDRPRGVRQRVRLFHGGKYRDARAAFTEPTGSQDPTVQSTCVLLLPTRVGTFYHNNALFERGLEAIERAIALAPMARSSWTICLACTPRRAPRRARERHPRDLSDLNPCGVEGAQ